jgi:hypothetical protein
MQKANLKITCRQLIDSATPGLLAQTIHQFSWNEFLLKSQVYNPGGKLETFTQMKDADGRAHSLHYKTGFPVTPLIEKLDNQIPDLYDNAGAPILFENWQFEVVESHTADKDRHIVAVNYITGWLRLAESFGQYLLLTAHQPLTNVPGPLFTLQLTASLSVTEYKPLPFANGVSRVAKWQEGM